MPTTCASGFLPCNPPHTGVCGLRLQPGQNTGCPDQGQFKNPQYTYSCIQVPSVFAAKLLSTYYICITLQCLPLVAESDALKKSKGLPERVEPRFCKGSRAQRLGISQHFSRRHLTLASLTCLLMHVSLGISVCNLVFDPSHRLQLPSWALVTRTNIY